MANTVTYDVSYALILGDLGPALAVTLLADGVPFALDPATDTATLVWLDPSCAHHAESMVIADPTNGVVARHWVSGDLPSIGAYHAQVQITRAGEDFPQSFPVSYTIDWHVTPAIESGVSPGPYGTMTLLGPFEFVAAGGEQDWDLPLTGATMADNTYQVLWSWAGGASGDGTQVSGAQFVDTPKAGKGPSSCRAVVGYPLVAGDRLQYSVFGRTL